MADTLLKRWREVFRDRWNLGDLARSDAAGLTARDAVIAAAAAAPPTDRTGDCSTLAAASTLGNSVGSKGVDGTAAISAGTTLGDITGVKATGESRSGTATGVSAATSLAASGTREISGTVQGITAVSGVSTASGQRAITGTAGTITAASSLLTASGKREIVGTAQGFSASTALLNVPGKKAASSGASFSVASALAALTGGKGASGSATILTATVDSTASGSAGQQQPEGTATTFTGATALSPIQGYSQRSGSASLSASTALGIALGVAFSPIGTASVTAAAAAAGSVTLGPLTGKGAALAGGLAVRSYGVVLAGPRRRVKPTIKVASLFAPTTYSKVRRNDMNETVYLGDSIEVNFKCVDGKSAPIDITGATLACSAQTPGGSVIVAASVALDNAAAGLWHAIFTTSQTAGFTPDTVYSYDGVVRLASGAVVTCGYGSVKTRKRISATP